MAFVVEMVVLAAFAPGAAPAAADTEPHVQRWVDGWGRPGDIGIVAWDGRVPIGAALARAFTEPLVRDADGAPVPEIAIAVMMDRRGRGVGQRLIEALIKVTDETGAGALSLAVNPGNPAVRLYEWAGFVPHGSDGHRIIMLRHPPAAS